jgi:hypothetical protein
MKPLILLMYANSKTKLKGFESKAVKITKSH